MQKEELKQYQEQAKKLFPALTRSEAIVLYLHKIKKLKHKEIALLLNITKRTSENSHYRAMRSLQQANTTVTNAIKQGVLDGGVLVLIESIKTGKGESQSSLKKKSSKSKKK